MNAIDDASTQAASTMRRHRGGASRPSSRGQGSASITPRLHGSTNGCASWRQARRLWFAGVVICSLVLGCRAPLTAVSHRGGRTPAREITSRHKIDRGSLLPLAARRDAVAACATCLDLRMAERTVAPLFPAAMETIHAGYWRLRLRAAINEYLCCRSHRVAPRASSHGCHSICRGEKRYAHCPIDRRSGFHRGRYNSRIRPVRIQ